MPSHCETRLQRNRGRSHDNVIEYRQDEHYRKREEWRRKMMCRRVAQRHTAATKKVNDNERFIHLHRTFYERSLFISMMILMNFYSILLYNSQVLSYERLF